MLKVLPLLLLIIPISAQAGNESVFSYTDGDGTVHFTDERPQVRYAVEELTLRETIREAVAKLSRTELKELITSLSDQYSVEASLVEAVVKAESEYDPMAVSKKGARGLMQLMPATAKSLGVRNVHDPKENLTGGVRYLRKLLTQFNNDIDLAVAAYNAGEGAVHKHNGIPPYAETIDYVQKVRKYYDQFRERASRSASRL